MQNFTFYAPTQICFGEGQVESLGELLQQYGSKVLLVYGKESIKHNGVYDAVVKQLTEHGIAHVELGGVDPNPRLATVVEGARLCQEHNLDFVLAVGGGSAIDCAKGIAAVALYDGDPWDFWAWKVKVEKALPIGTVLTLAATGSEMNNGTVITNDATQEKHGMSSPVLAPKFSILDPTYTYSVPSLHTAAGVADIMAHIYEYYFSPIETAFLQDALAEAILKTCVRYGPLACAEPENYEARANLMWASSLALNGLTGRGKTFDGFNHLVEHAVSALYDLTHGVGLAILAPHWMAYILDDDTASKLATFARNVWGLDGADDIETARRGIQRTRQFYCDLGLPSHFREVGIGQDRFEEIVQKSVFRETIGSFKQLTRQDVLNILHQAA